MISHQTDRILRVPEVVEITGLSRTSLWRAEREGRFPKRRIVGRKAVGYLASEVEAWLQSRPLASLSNQSDFDE